MRLIYRFIFLITVEERGLLHPADSDPAARERYAQGYALARLRPLCLRRRLRTRHSDQWTAIRIIFTGLNSGQPLLALPALGGLFDPEQCPDLDAADIDNAHLLAAMRHLRWAKHADAASRLLPIDWRNMDSEEMGSVYESLLELTPAIDLAANTFSFTAAAGNARKLTGSYYTPSSLVDELIHSALDPVIEQRLAEALNGEQLTVNGTTPLAPVGANNHSPLLSQPQKTVVSNVHQQQTPATKNKEEGYTQELPLAPATAGGEGQGEGARRAAAHSSRFTVHRAIAALLSIRVIDPACGSGHFLLAAARRLAEKLAWLQSLASGGEGAVTPDGWRAALRRVAARCIYGVDRNPLAIELARMSLWLEAHDASRPLSFLDHHLQVGDALLGAATLDALQRGIPKEAYKPLTGDDKATCKALAKENATALKQLNLPLFDTSARLAALRALEGEAGDTTESIAAQRRAWADLRNADEGEGNLLATAADLCTGAWLLPKTEGSHCPTTATLIHLLDGSPSESDKAAIAAARAACRDARVLHWPLAFPQIFLANGETVNRASGFDCVLGNPPWERIKLQEEEFFATRSPDIATARNKTERKKRIRWLAEGQLAANLHPELAGSAPSEAEQRLHADFLAARRAAEATSAFVHAPADGGGRYPLTGTGDVNTYALFAETILAITSPAGRAGFIVPTNIATDDSTKDYFAHLTKHRRIVTLYDFENREKLFSAVDSRMKYCLLTLGAAEQAEFIFFATNAGQLGDTRRRFTLSADDFALINPNTRTCPVFRSGRDAELTKKLYRAAPVLWQDKSDTQEEHNPWGISFMAMFHMSNDSALFKYEPATDRLPLYEGKMVQAYDHRAASVEVNPQNRVRAGQPKETTLSEHQDVSYTVTPQCWVTKTDVDKALQGKWAHKWMIAFKSITGATNERTFISSLVPFAGLSNSLIGFISPQSPENLALFYANQNCLVLDYVAKNKVNGVNLNFFLVKQLPFLPPERYSQADLDFIVPRVLELTYTAHDMRPWAEDVWQGWQTVNSSTAHHLPAQPYPFDPERRAILRAELDAWYARLYGLTEDELRYILDPASIMGADWPSQTFRVLREKEIKQYGEYRTQRLVLEAWQRLHDGAALA